MLCDQFVKQCVMKDKSFITCHRICFLAIDVTTATGCFVRWWIMPLTCYVSFGNIYHTNLWNAVYKHTRFCHMLLII